MAAELVVVLAAEAEELGPPREERERQPPERRVAPAVPEDHSRPARGRRVDGAQSKSFHGAGAGRVDGARERRGARRREPGHVHDFKIRVEPV